MVKLRGSLRENSKERASEREEDAANKCPVSDNRKSKNVVAGRELVFVRCESESRGEEEEEEEERKIKKHREAGSVDGAVWKRERRKTKQEPARRYLNAGCISFNFFAARLQEFSSIQRS